MEDILVAQSNLACAYHSLGRVEQALRVRRDTNAGWIRLYGEADRLTLQDTNGLANLLTTLKHFEEATSLLRRTIPVARRVLGEDSEHTLRMRWYYARALFTDRGAAFDELREAVTTLEDTARRTRRVFGGAHPLTSSIEEDLKRARVIVVLHVATPSGSAV